jgi:hypothetical protein
LHLDNFLSKKASVREKVYILGRRETVIVEEINPENA